MVDNQHYDVVFRGDIAPGETLADVKQRLGELFRLDETRLSQLFSGRPVVVKRGLPAEEAERYRLTLTKAGALVQLRPGAVEPPVASSVAPAAVPASSPDTRSSNVIGSQAAGYDAEPEVAPVGANVLRPEERPVIEPVDPDIGYLSVAEAGSEVLRPEERRSFEPLELDLSHLSVAPTAGEGR